MPVLQEFEHSEMLGILARSKAARLKALAETLIPHLGVIEVEQSRTGLVMLPMRDTAQGVNFHLGEVLVSEARIICAGHLGYGMRRGRDLEAAMAMALVDLSVSMGVRGDACAVFLRAESKAQTEADNELLRKVEATRVDMETF